MPRKFAKIIIAEAEALGLREVHVERRRHNHLFGLVDGRLSIRLVFPATPSDWRSERNCIATLRRLVRNARGGSSQ